jgi:hypothetical protein
VLRPFRYLICCFAAALSFSAVARERGFVMNERGDAAVCLPSGARMHRSVRAGAVPLHVIGEDVRDAAAGGLNIVLRATEQLEAYPAAMAAFERAAAVWEARIANPITVYVDVDFGPLLFGQPFPGGFVAIAIPDDRVSDEGAYAELRRLLAAHADNAAEAALYAALPADSIPTDLGSTTRYNSPAPLLRALGALPATASPSESAPALGFNSSYAYDLDPSDGITANRLDFEGVVVHEIGHMLGFVSKVGDVELGAPVNAPAIFDLFRFRPGVTMDSFSSAPRIVTAGGDHFYFAGGEPLELSTGRDDATGGDRRAASHWKDDAFTGTALGIMDPTVKRGVALRLTETDLAVLDMLGYTLAEPPVDPPPPARPGRRRSVRR